MEGFFKGFVLKNVIEKKNKREETWTFNPSKYLAPPSFYPEKSPDSLTNFPCIAGIISPPVATPS